MAGCPRPAEGVGRKCPSKLRPPCWQKNGFGALEDAYCQHPMRAQKLCLDTSIGQSDPGSLSIACPHWEAAYCSAIMELSLAPGPRSRPFGMTLRRGNCSFSGREAEGLTPTIGTRLLSQ